MRDKKDTGLFISAEGVMGQIFNSLARAEMAMKHCATQMCYNISVGSRILLHEESLALRMVTTCCIKADF